MRMMASAAALLVGLLAAGCNGDVVGGGQRPARMVVVSGDLQTATVGEELPQPLVVRVLDDSNEPVRSQLVNFVVTAGGGAVFAGAALTNENGEARERWRLGTVAGDTQRVEARAVDATTGEALVFAVFRAVAQAGAPSTITPVAAQVNGLAGLPVADSVAAVVRDGYGNPVAGAQVAWTVTGGGGSVSPATSATNAQGIARAQWTLGGSLSPQTLQAAAGVNITTTVTANAGLGGAAALTRVSGDAQTGVVGAPLAQPLVVELRQNGVPVAGAQVVWAPAPGMGSASPATSITDAQGRASTAWTLGTGVGTQTLSAQVQGGASVVFFSAQATAGAPASLERVAPPADANPGYAGVDTLFVRVRDAQGNVAANTTVTWTVVNGGGTVTAQSATGPDGVAAAIWQLGSHDGDQAVTASVAGLDPVLYHWNLVNSRPAASFTRVSGDGQTAPFDAYVDKRLAVRLTDANGNGIYNAPVQWITPAGQIQVTGTTDIDGYSYYYLAKAGTTPAPQTFTAHTPGMTNLAFTVTGVPGPANGVRIGADSLVHVLFGQGHPGFSLPMVIYDAAGNALPLQYWETMGYVTARLLDNTGAIVLGIHGNNLRSYGYATRAYGSDRIEVTHKSSGIADTVTVHVRELPPEPGMLIGNQGTMPHVLNVGGTAQARVFFTWFTEVRTAQQVTWSSSNPSVATVSATGNVTAVGPGVAVITAQGWWGGTVRGYVLVPRP
ncbi:Ig-like domain-containing protein [Longimicrobium sp.]|uniref:Ig-like domain-containing protein n=1 Tax=Longimicrobium sp. TaxID=2029185 RepID=UPI003B3B1C04